VRRQIKVNRLEADRDREAGPVGRRGSDQPAGAGTREGGSVSKQDNKPEPLWVSCLWSLVGLGFWGVLGVILAGALMLVPVVVKAVAHAAGAVTKAASEGWDAGRQ
jgi:hypothetical protein